MPNSRTEPIQLTHEVEWDIRGVEHTRGGTCKGTHKEWNIQTVSHRDKTTEHTQNGIRIEWNAEWDTYRVRYKSRIHEVNHTEWDIGGTHGVEYGRRT